MDSRLDELRRKRAATETALENVNQKIEVAIQQWRGAQRIVNDCDQALAARFKYVGESLDVTHLNAIERSEVMSDRAVFNAFHAEQAAQRASGFTKQQAQEKAESALKVLHELITAERGTKETNELRV